ncbi:MAG: protein-L-isoaspartate O-methyltransferase family protein [Metallibacterium sp.]
MTLDFELARQNMVSNQVRTWEVLDARVLDVLAALRREDFVPAAYRDMAFADLGLPLGHGEVMMKPVVEGRMLQALELAATDNVLEIGTGSGFITACLARLAGHVTSLDIHAEFTTTARAALRAAGCDNAEAITTEAVREFAPAQRYDAIAVTGAVATLPQRWLGWLKPGGRLFVVQGRAPAMQATLLRVAVGTTEILFETDLPYLQHAAPVPRFVL